jgi:hypothetical protein
MKRYTAYITIVSFLGFEATPLIARQSVRPAVASSAATAARTTAATVDGGWPRGYVTPTGARVVLYQPQVESWPDQKQMTLYAAVSYLATGAQKPSLGSLKIESNTSVSLTDRLVNFSEFKITEASFPTVDKDTVKTVVEEIVNAIPREQRVIGLDRVLASVDTSQIIPKNANGVKADPPKIFVSQTPAVLVNLDGDPIWSPIAQNELKFAVNTNWDLFEHPTTKQYYLRVEKAWLSAPSLDGPWTAATLPASFASLPTDGNWDDVRATLNAHSTTVAHPPVVFVSTTPAELILFDGSPRPVPVKGTQLLWMSNTESDVFRAGADGLVYFLVSGRWFSAPGYDGPWTFTTPKLPDDFDRIPLDHPRSRVLASVPGTRQALEAVLLSQIPQTARVNRKEIQAPAVSYQGEPQFDPIEQTTVSRAANTDKDILKVGDRYYMCFQGVWFFASSPAGPWQVADSVPGAIYEIPISSPAYNVTQVTVEDSDDDWVEFAAAAAYSGLMVGWGCAMWGTGYYYPPYVGWSGLYPAYLPSYPSYGYGARYNPWNGTYSRGGGIYGPNGGAGYGARYNPATGTYARGAAAYGPGGARGAIAASNPRTGTRAATAQGRNVYGSWGSTAVQRGDQWAQTSRVTRNATGTTGRVTQGSGGGSVASRRGPQGGGTVGRTAGGDVYAGRDGNVYRNQGGSWQKYGSGGWSDAQRPVGTSGTLSGQARDRATANPSTVDQLNRDRGARTDGSQRTRDFQRSSGGSRSGSYRPSGGSRGFGGGGMRGGGMRGGGGRRR